MKRLTNWQLGALLIGAVGVGAVLSGVIGPDRDGRGERAEPVTTIVLADPLDPPEKRVVEPSAESRRGAGSASTPPPTAAGAAGGGAQALAAQGDRASQTRAKEILKARVLDGGASDSERRMLKALCKLLGDQSCVD
ncbi:MAG: hypothetical protein L6Q84_26045 [Polyangiaceae bacterium]|nr:hypothetical protein [Polyangiaceae bacterium]